MLNNSKQPKNWQKTLSLISQCPVCSQDYDKKTEKQFLDVKNTHLVHMTCNNCQSYFLAMVMELGKGVSTIGMITDLSYEDVKRTYKTKAIRMDEVIEASQLLNKNNIINIL